MIGRSSTLRALGLAFAVVAVVACGGARTAPSASALAFAPPPGEPVRVAVASSRVAPPPPAIVNAIGLSRFYTKWTDVGGFPIVASSRVSDVALLEAAFLVEKMVGQRPDILRAMAARRIRLAVMAPTEMTTDLPEHADLTPRAYWDRRARGLGATQERPAVSAAEENLLDLRGDPYAAENILIHEFAHAIHLEGLVAVDPSFDGRLRAAYANATATGLWKGTYASTNAEEYWAEATQSWFDCNRVNDNEHGPIDTRDKVKAYDPQIAALLVQVFGDGLWRYAKPRRRAPGESPHLAGFDPTTRDPFVWPEANRLEPPPATLSWLPAATPPAATPSGNAAATSVTFENRRARAVTLSWNDYQGVARLYATIPPGRSHVQQTYAGHVWIVAEDGRRLGTLSAVPAPARAEIR